MGDWDYQMTWKDWVVVGVIFLIAIFVLNTHKQRMVAHAGRVEEEHFPAPVVEFVPPVAPNSHLPSINDDGAGSVYLRLAGNGPDPEIYPDDAMARLMEGKKWWKENHPEKKIISISVVHDSFYDRTCVVGLLMAYEDK